MGKNNLGLANLLASAVAAFGITASVFASADPLPRGGDVAELAGNCGVKGFPQTTKAGGYNTLCAQMEEAEICLAFLKQHFDYQGKTTTTHKPGKLAYCLEELGDALGAP